MGVIKMGYLLYEDWSDNKYSNRTALISLGGTLNQAGGCLIPKISWVLDTGSVTFSDRVATLTPGTNLRGRPIPFNPNKTLVWEFRARCTYSGYDHALRISLLAKDGNNRWTHFAPNWQQAGILNYLWKIVNGSSYFVISKVHSGDTNWHIIKGKRSPDGTWEIFYDGISEGTAIDTWMPDSISWFYISNDPGTYVHNVELDYLKVWEE